MRAFTRASGPSSSQIRAARAMANWSQDELATASGLSIATIRKLELGFISPRASTADAIRDAIENAGLEFIDLDGVRRRNDDIVIFEGANGIESLLNDIADTVKKRNEEIAIVVSPEMDFFPTAKFLESSFAIKCLIADCQTKPRFAPNLQCRALSRHYVEPVPFCVYGDKHAIFTHGKQTGPKVIMIQSRTAANAARRQFFSMWEKATAFAA